MHPFAELTVLQGSVGIHWFEQNAYALKDSRGTVLFIDPYFPTFRPAEKFIRPQPPVVEADLPVDYVLLTHRHGDHTNPETLTRIHAAQPDVVVIGPPESIAQVLGETPIDAAHTITINAGESVAIGDIGIRAFYSKPPQGDPAAGIAPPDVTHLGYVIAMEGIRLYVTGDAINTFADHDELLAPIAKRKPHVGFLTTHPTEGEFPFFEDSVRLAQKLGLKTAIPAHYECFAQRTYDPHVWAALFPDDGPQPLVIPWNSHFVYRLNV